VSTSTAKRLPYDTEKPDVSANAIGERPRTARATMARRIPDRRSSIETNRS
jgi:hypothetical protein